MTATETRLPSQSAGPDGWSPESEVPAPAEPPATPPPGPRPSAGDQNGPAGTGRPSRRRQARAIGGAGTLLLVVSVLMLIWPALAVVVLAVATAALLVRRGVEWAGQASRRARAGAWRLARSRFCR